MTEIRILATKSTPSVISIKDKSVIQLKGISIMEDARKFYINLGEQIREYISDMKKLHLVFKVIYLNSASAYHINELIKFINEKLELSVTWYYESDDEGMLETGELFEHLSDSKFTFKEVDMLY